MPRRKRNRKKEREKFFIRKFLAALGYSIARPRWKEKPDAIITLVREGASKRVGIEHTDYHCDAPPGTPSQANVEEFWRLVQDSVVRRVCRHPRLRRTLVTAWLANPTQLASLRKKEKLRVARELAGELVEFVRQIDCVGHSKVKQRPRGQRTGIWEYVRRVQAFDPGDGYASPRSTWSCHNTTAAQVALNLGHVKAAIHAKAKKAKGYDWQGASEKWLLIVAAGFPVQKAAGPPTQDVDWSNSELQAACAASGFDKVYFFERASNWYKPVWPEAPVVKLRNDR